MKRVLFIATLLAVTLVARLSYAAGDAESLKNTMAKDFSFKTLAGQDLKLSDQRGKVVLVDTWATWCPPCRESLPHVQKLSSDQAMANKGLVVWAVDIKETKPDIEKFVSQNKYTFTVLMDSAGQMLKEYLVSGIPTTFVIGRDGTIKDVFVGYGGEASAKQIDAAVAKALADRARQIGGPQYRAKIHGDAANTL